MQNSVAVKNDNNRNSKIGWETQYILVKGMRKIFKIQCGQEVMSVNPKGGGRGPKVPSGFSIGCHFSQDHAMVTKILDFIHIHPN